MTWRASNRQLRDDGPHPVLRCPKQTMTTLMTRRRKMKRKTSSSKKASVLQPTLQLLFALRVPLEGSTGKEEPGNLPLQPHLLHRPMKRATSLLLRASLRLRVELRPGGYLGSGQANSLAMGIRERKPRKDITQLLGSPRHTLRMGRMVKGPRQMVCLKGQSK